MMRKKPMLAYPVSAKPIDYSEPVFIQPKLDGVRCVIQLDHEANERGEFPVKAYSRTCLLYTSPSPRDRQKSRMPSSA